MKKVFKIAGFVLAGAASLSLIVITLLFFISGGFMKQAYLEPWSRDYAQKQTDPRLRVAAIGLLAANNHNMQPWRIQLDSADPMVFYLYADSSRMTGEVDPYARQMMISQGTFLEYVVVAGEQAGWNAAVVLFPNGPYDESRLADSMNAKPVAKITLSKTQAKSSAMYDAVFLPDTNREAYKQHALSAAQVSALESLSDKKGIAVKLCTDRDDLNKIGSYAIQSAAIEAGVTRVMDESNAIFRSNEYQKNKYRYGYSVEGQGVSGFMKNVIQGLVTVFPSMNSGKAASQNFISYTRTSVDHTPAYAMIQSAGNSRSEQVESGMLYSRLVLKGHTLGLAMQPLSQVLEEYPEMRGPYNEFMRAYAPDGGTVQMLFRVGIPKKDAPQSMRRDIGELVTEFHK